MTARLCIPLGWTALSGLEWTVTSGYLPDGFFVLEFTHPVGHVCNETDVIFFLKNKVGSDSCEYTFLYFVDVVCVVLRFNTAFEADLLYSEVASCISKMQDLLSVSVVYYNWMSTRVEFTKPFRQDFSDYVCSRGFVYFIIRVDLLSVVIESDDLFKDIEIVSGISMSVCARYTDHSLILCKCDMNVYMRYIDYFERITKNKRVNFKVCFH